MFFFLASANDLINYNLKS